MIVVPKLKKYGEHNDDNQLEIAKKIFYITTDVEVYLFFFIPSFFQEKVYML